MRAHMQVLYARKLLTRHLCMRNLCVRKGAYTPPRLKTSANCLYPTTPCLSSDPFGRIVALKRTTKTTAKHSSVYVLSLREMQ